MPKMWRYLRAFSECFLLGIRIFLSMYCFCCLHKDIPLAWIMADIGCRRRGMVLASFPVLKDIQQFLNFLRRHYYHFHGRYWIGLEINEHDINYFRELYGNIPRWKTGHIAYGYNITQWFSDFHGINLDQPFYKGMKGDHVHQGEKKMNNDPILKPTIFSL